MLSTATGAQTMVTSRGFSGQLKVDYVNYNAAGGGGSPPTTCVWELRIGRTPGCGTQGDFFPAINATYTDRVWVNDTMGGTAQMAYKIVTYYSGAPCVQGVGGVLCVQAALVGNLALNVSCTQSVVICERSITYNATVHGGTHPYSHHWDFGNGGQSSATNPSHQYTGPGQCTIILTVTDPHGLRVQATVVLVLE